MSASRICLLAAAAVGGALLPTASCWAQAYGAKAIVEHNDLRWFEPIELDVDGQMPRRDAGWFFSADKLAWATINPKVEIGEAGKTVDSERIYRAPSTELAFTALEQVENFAFVDSLEENLSYSGIRFVLANTQGTDSLSDDTTSVFNTSLFADVNALSTAIRAFNLDAGNIANNQEIRVGGEPQPYQVRNSIRDALPDAGFAWGERYEFGYSDGDQGWMITVLDGPESNSGGVYGAGEGAPYFSQSGREFYGPDPFFNSDLEDDGLDGEGDGDGELGAVDLFALGFGSVAVNFNLPNGDFLKGYRDYFNNDAGAAGGTTSGPILYVGNYGTTETDLNVLSVNGGGTGGAVDITAQDAINSLNVFDNEQMEVDPVEALLQAQTIAIINELNRVNTLLTVDLDPDDEDDFLFIGALGILSTAQSAASALQTAVLTAIANDPGGMVNMDQFDPEVATLNAALTQLELAVDPLIVTVDIDTDNDQDIDATEQNRVADDVDGNGNAGVTRVLADIDGDGIIEEGEIVALINNFGDLHEFNVFFDQVTVRNRTELDGVELMRMHEISTRHKLQQGRWDDLRFSYGVRFLSAKDDFYFQGRGSILGRTTVETDIENQIVGPQIGLKWTRRDGPWNFVFEARGTAGYNIVDVDQYGIFGEELVPGALNRPVVARTTTSQDGERFNEFSPLGEIRAQVQYRIAESISLQAGYTAKYVGNIHRGSTATAWNAPDFGVRNETGDLFTNGLNIGIELRH